MRDLELSWVGVDVNLVVIFVFLLLCFEIFDIVPVHAINEPLKLEIFYSYNHH